MIPAGKIYALTLPEAQSLERHSGSWELWYAIGRRLGVNFNPDDGPIPSVERTGWLSIAVTWQTRKCQSQVAAVNASLDPRYFTMPRYQGRAND